MFGDRRKLLMGGAVIAVLAGAIWVLWPASPRPAPSAPAVPRGTQNARPDTKTPLVPIKIEALTAGREEPGEGQRNPFRYQPKAPPPRQAPAPAAEVAEPPRPALPVGPPPLPPIGLKFIGVLERASGEKWAVLSDGKVTMHGRDGDIVDGRYRIVKIGTESVELAYADGRGRQVVRLTGQ